MDSKSLTYLFFSELKKYNSTNFHTLESVDVNTLTPTVKKAFSSIITRFFIFIEKHPEITETEQNLVYYQLKLDMIGRFFSEHPVGSTEDLIAFQKALREYVDYSKRNNNKKDGEE